MASEPTRRRRKLNHSADVTVRQLLWTLDKYGHRLSLQECDAFGVAIAALDAISGGVR